MSDFNQMNYVVFFKYHILCLLDNLCRLLFSCNKTTKISKLRSQARLTALCGIYNSQIKLHIPFKRQLMQATNVSEPNVHHTKS